MRTIQKVKRRSKASLQREAIVNAIPDVRVMRDKHGQRAILGALRKLSEYDKRRAELNRLQAEVKKIEGDIIGDFEKMLDIEKVSGQ